MITEYENPWFSVCKEGKYHFIKENGADNGAVIIGDTGEEYLFVQVRRAAHDMQVFIELPRGYGEAGESSLDAAIRELYEETGFKATAQQLEKLGSVQPNSAILSATVDVYLAKVSLPQRLKAPDDEVEKLIFVAKSSIGDYFSSGKISDGFTLSAFALLWAKYPDYENSHKS